MFLNEARQSSGRRKRLGPESDMIDLSIRSIASLAGRSSIVLHEPRMPTGFPDVVLAKPSRAMRNLQSHDLKRADFKLLHHLVTAGTSNVQSLGEALGWSESGVRRAVERLRDMGLVSRNRRDEVSPALKAQSFLPKRIIAIEAKMRDWSQAIDQARANTWFASQSYVLIPSELDNAGIHSTADRAGVGVLIFDGKKTRVAHRATERSLPASYGSWLIASLVRRTMAALSPT